MKGEYLQNEEYFHVKFIKNYCLETCIQYIIKASKLQDPFHMSLAEMNT